MDISLRDNNRWSLWGHSLSFILFAFVFHTLAYSSFFNLAFLLDGFGNYSLWFPPAGFRIAMIFILGWRFGIMVALAEITAQGFLGDWATWGHDPVKIFFGSGSPSFVCAFVIYLLERFKLTSPKLENFQHVAWFVAALMLTPLLAAPVASGLKVLGGRVLLADMPVSIMSYWIGDMLGMLMITPIVVMGFNAYLSRSWGAFRSITHPQFILEFTVATAFIWAIVQFAGGGPLSLRWIPFIIPVVAIALRHGFLGAALIVMALNFMTLGMAGEVETIELYENQGFMAVVSLMGLTLGGLASARNRAKQAVVMQYKNLTMQDRRNTMNDLAVHIIHELAQPINTTSLYAQGAVKMLENNTLDKETLLAAMNSTAAETTRTLELIRRMQNFAREGELENEETDTSAVVEGIAHMIDMAVKGTGVKVIYDLPVEPLSFTVDNIQIQQAVLNLARNSIEAMEGYKDKLLTIRSYRNDEGSIVIAVKDTGPGMDGGMGESSKPNGMGVGLNIVAAIMEAHGGFVVRNGNIAELVFRE